MDRLDRLGHLDKGLVDELAQVAREVIREELREQTRAQRRRAALFGAAGAVALYAGAAVACALGLALAIGLPGWAAALITAAVLAVVAWLLRDAAVAGPSGPTKGARPSGESLRPWGQSVPSSGESVPSSGEDVQASAENVRPSGETAPEVPTREMPVVPPRPRTAPTAGQADPADEHHRP